MAQGAVIPIALAAVAVGASVYSAYSQIDTANRAADLQREQIRQQQVQLRLQENQSSIERMKNLRAVLASQEVMLGERNISPASGSVRAIYNQDFVDFEEDDTASKLNYSAKRAALSVQNQGVNLEQQARKTSAVTGFFKDAASVGLAYYGIPSQNLVDKSAPKTNQFNLNR